MIKETTKIELTEKDIKILIAEKFNLDINNTSVRVSHYKGDQREPSYTNIIVEGVKNK